MQMVALLLVWFDVQERNCACGNFITVLFSFGVSLLRNLDNLFNERIGIDINQTDMIIIIPAHKPSLLHDLLWFLTIVGKEGRWDLEKYFTGRGVTHYPSVVVGADVEVLGQVGREEAVHLELVVITYTKG